MIDSEIKIFSGDFEIISTGIVNLKNETFSIHVKNLKIDFLFKKDSSDKTHFEGEKLSDEKILLTIYNMQNALLEGFYTPVEIGILGNRRFFINFAAWSLDAQENIRTVVYNLLLFKEV